VAFVKKINFLPETTCYYLFCAHRVSIVQVTFECVVAKKIWKLIIYEVLDMKIGGFSLKTR
jgi:hypothetical protein